MRSFEHVIVGAGVSSLVAALRLQQDGHRVTIVEQCDRVGGYFGGFTNPDGDRFDLAVSHLLGGIAGEPFAEFLAELGIDPAEVLEPVGICDRIVLRGRTFDLPTGMEALEQRLREYFPGEGDSIESVMGFFRAFLGEGDRRSSAQLMMQNYKRHFEEYAKQEIADDDLRNLLAMRIQCDDSSLMIMAGFLTECYGKGMVYPRGGVAALVERLAELVVDRGGRIRLGSRATGLTASGTRATGVRLADGTTLPADVVLHNGDYATLREWAGELGVELPAHESRKRGHSSLSIFPTLDGADLSRFEGPARVYLTDTSDVFATYRVLETGALPEEPVIKLHIMSRIDPTLAEAGRDLLRIEVDMFHYRTDHDGEFYRAYADEVIARVTRDLVPEIADRLVYRRDVSPIDYESMFGHAGGSATGWAHDVANYMNDRMSQKVALENVFVTGQWGEFGSGLPQLMLSADRSVRLAKQWSRKEEGK